MRIILVLLFSLSAGVYAQGISHSIILAAAGDYNGQEVQVTYSIGEPVAGYMVASGVALSQGFQQDPAILLDIDELPVPERMSVSVYPNPSHSKITVRLPDQSAATIHIADLLGRERAAFDYPRGSSGIELSLQGLEPGMYIVHIVSGSRRTAASRLLQFQP